MNPHQLVRLGVALILCSNTSWSALPADAKRMLDTFPEKKVTLDLVINRGMEASDTFRAIRGSAPAIEASRLEAQSILDYQLTASVGRGINQNEPQTPFNPNNIESTDFSVGLSKSFITGTGANFGFKHGRTDIGFPLNPSFPIGDYGFYETRASLALTQDLWRNSFGKSTRLLLDAGEAQSDAAKQNLLERVQNWETELRSIFYQTWIAQSEAKIASDTVERRKRFVEVIRIKLNRGTAERPDLLQIQSAELQSKAQEAQNLQTLSDRWRGLVVLLKLPEAWISVDPREIPMGLDDPMARADSACESAAQNPVPTTRLKRAQAQAQAALRSAESAKEGMKPRLYLQGELAGNDIDTAQRSNTFGKTFELENPAWNVSLNLSMPLGNHAAEATARNAAAQMLQAEAIQDQEQSNLKLFWLNSCADLKRTQASYRLLKEAFENQRQRVELEEQRFRLGRSTTQFVIQAQDEKAGAEANLIGAEISRRVAAWNVIQLHESYRTRVEDLAKVGSP